jgi:hypothetical protein
MLLTARSPFTSLYRVEISGWDATHSFFVERSDLEWNEETGKHILLNHSLPEGAMIFVRLLQPVSEDRSLPVAYEAEFAGHTRDGRNEFLLKQAQPRTDGSGVLVQ